MALNASGPISLGGTTAGQSIAVENGGSGTAQISLNDTAVRTLAGVASGAITMPTNFWGKSNHVPFSTKVTYTADSTLTIPSGLGITAARVKAWGAGGGNYKLIGTSSGGGGGFAQADIAVTAGTLLGIKIGGGGLQGVVPASTAGANGGGRGWGYNGSVASGGGGGYSGVFLNNTVSQANAKIIAGGGGGSISGNPSTSRAGAGGGSTGQAGTGSTAGTQTAGGSLGGAALQGGNASAGNANGGGGGGGYWGGGGNPTSTSSGYNYSGSGGSGFVTGTNTTNTTGALTVPANTGDVDYVAGKGTGGATSTSQNGGAGYVVIYY